MPTDADGADHPPELNPRYRDFRPEQERELFERAELEFAGVEAEATAHQARELQKLGKALAALALERGGSIDVDFDLMCSLGTVNMTFDLNGSTLTVNVEEV